MAAELFVARLEVPSGDEMIFLLFVRPVSFCSFKCLGEWIATWLIAGTVENHRFCSAVSRT